MDNGDRQTRILRFPLGPPKHSEIGTYPFWRAKGHTCCNRDTRCKSEIRILKNLRRPVCGVLPGGMVHHLKYEHVL
jgi:hypothetical protein